MEFDTRKFVEKLLSKLPIIAIVSIAIAVLAVVYAVFLHTSTYSSTATIWASAYEETTSEYQNALTVQNRINSFAAITKTGAVLDKVAQTLKDVNESGVYSGPCYTANQLKSMISTSVSDNTELFYITVTDTDPRYAQFIAKEIASEACHYLEVERSEGRFTVVDEPLVPVSSNDRSPASYGIIGFLLGLMACVGVIFVITLLDTRITSENDIKDVVDTVIVGIIPCYDWEDGTATEVGKKR